MSEINEIISELASKLIVLIVDALVGIIAAYLTYLAFRFRDSTVGKISGLGAILFWIIFVVLIWITMLSAG